MYKLGQKELELTKPFPTKVQRLQNMRSFKEVLTETILLIWKRRFHTILKVNRPTRVLSMRQTAPLSFHDNRSIRNNNRIYFSCDGKN